MALRVAAWHALVDVVQPGAVPDLADVRAVADQLVPGGLDAAFADGEGPPSTAIAMPAVITGCLNGTCARRLPSLASVRGGSYVGAPWPVLNGSEPRVNDQAAPQARVCYVW